MSGWIALHRSLMEHWLWKSKEPFDKRSAWVDLLLLATHTDNKELYKGNLVTRKRGEICCSMLWLAERWRWDRKKVKQFLSLLESDGMLSVNSTRQGTTLTIENYSKWQNYMPTDDTTIGTTTTPTTTPTTGTTTPHTKQCITMNNNEKQCRTMSSRGEKKSKKFVPPTIADVSAYVTEQGYHINAEHFIDYYEANGWLVGRNKMKDWKATVRNWERRENGNNGRIKSSNPFTEMLKNGDYE